MTAWKPGTIWVARTVRSQFLNTAKYGHSGGSIQIGPNRDPPPKSVYVPLTPGYYGRDLDTDLGWTRFNLTDEMIDMLQPWIGHLWGEP